MVDAALWLSKAKRWNTRFIKRWGKTPAYWQAYYANGVAILRRRLGRRWRGRWGMWRGQAGVLGVSRAMACPRRWQTRNRRCGLLVRRVCGRRTYLAPKLFEELRVTVGEDVHLLRTMMCITADADRRRGWEIAGALSSFLDSDSGTAELQEGFKLSEHTTTPAIATRGIQ